MFILLNFGVHPLYIKGDTKNVYIDKLKNPKWRFNVKISKMAKNFFGKLVEVDPSHRYTAGNALNHPFITRKKFDQVPLTYLEIWKHKSIKIKCQEFIGMIIFMKYCIAVKNKKVFFTVEKEYKSKVDKRSKRNSEQFIRKRETCLGRK
jgi:serine/threonine protein kinase